jgi:adenylate cyclase
VSRQRALALRILDIGADPGDDSDLRVRKRTAVVAAIVFMSVAVVLGTADAILEQWQAVILAVIQIAAFGAALALFRRTHHLTPLVATMSIGGLLILLAALIPSGGLTADVADLIWIILVPIAAVLFLGSRAGVPALVGVVLVVAVAVVADPYIRQAPPEPTLARLLFTAVDIIVPAALALALVVFIDGERVREKAESDALLLNVMPRSIAERLKGGERVIADHCEDVTILFADVVEFTPFAARESPARVVAVLNEVFSRFDRLAEERGLEKIKTMGDAYMVVAGVPDPRPYHAAVVVDMALAMQAAAASIEIAPGQPIRLRIGIASGPVVAGVIGTHKFSYDLWGDTVNLASRMESTALPGTIQVTESTKRRSGTIFRFEPRDVEVKGLGLLRTYVLQPSVAGTGAEDPTRAPLAR